jgi:hypothetical protein
MIVFYADAVTGPKQDRLAVIVAPIKSVYYGEESKVDNHWKKFVMY